MYSEHGLLALMRPPSGQVCHALIVESYCTPGSAHFHAAKQIFSQSPVAGIALESSPSVRRTRFQSSFASTASKKSSEIRTLLFEFWPLTV